ncbi:MAG: hypothetical protein V2I35_06425 [Desulfocapsaceae bacterium]|jgi:hypothetical protein|nr:hypothetical protein [Desulfocapsaceae bacterium]
MNDHSRGKRRFPKGLPIETGPKAKKKIRLDQPLNRLPNARSATLTWSPGKKATPKGPHMIRKAYFEPLGNTLIENILLQRNYIID